MTQNSHSKIEKSIFLLLVLTILVTSVGACVQILPLFIRDVSIEQVEGMRPYTPLELAGFNIYKREGCYNCHSQQIRPLRDEFERYGHYSLAAESMYDYPFQWGSKRTGPDLARLGEKYSDQWHVEHLINPRNLVSVSVMPGYPHLIRKALDYSEVKAEMKILKMLGVPYSDDDIENAEFDLLLQAGIEDDYEGRMRFSEVYNSPAIRIFDGNSSQVSEMDAIIAYLQSLGRKVDLETNLGRNW